MAKRECPGCRKLARRVAELEALVRELRARLGINATNSSLPPSANPPGAPAPVTKEPTGRSPGAQPGHTACVRQRLPAERLSRVIRFVPETCAHCRAALSPQPAADDPEPRWHQVAELPAAPVEVIEYQAQGRTCSCCGALTWATIPEQVRAHAFGPRLAAAVAYLSGSPHVSKRGIEELVETVFGLPISLGSVINIEQEMSAALGAAHAEAKQAVRQAPVKHVDETGWKRAGERCWLWGAATACVACFVIHPSRGAAGLAALLGRRIKGIICTDRWGVYGRLKAGRRQLCWAHLKRDFQKLVDRGGEAREVGEFGLALTGLVFELWHLFRGGGLGRRQLRHQMREWREALHDQLERGRACADAKAAAFCANVLNVEAAVWTFVDRGGVEPTNNHMERLLRTGVLWRKNAFGCHSEAGCRFVERILTVVQTLRLQQRPVLAYLHQTLVAHRHGKAAPMLLSAG
jgi:transposase